MDVEVAETSKFQVRLRTPNNLTESSKKYKVPVDKLLPFQYSISAYVEFDDDYFTQIVQFERVNNQYKEKICLLEILHNDKVVSCNEIELTQFLQYDKATKSSLKLDGRPIVNISYMIEITQILDYDEESTVMPEIYQKALKARESATAESREVIEKLTELNQRLVKENTKLIDDIKKV